jgi:hypothetical protein
MPVNLNHMHARNFSSHLRGARVQNHRQMRALNGTIDSPIRPVNRLSSVASLIQIASVAKRFGDVVALDTFDTREIGY